MSVQRINRAGKLLAGIGVVGFSNLGALLKYAWRRERSIFLEAIVVFIIIEFGFVVVVLSAVTSATTFAKVLHG